MKYLVARKVPLLIMHGEDDEYYRDFAAARSGPLGSVLEEAGPRLRVLVSEGRLYAVPTVASQDLTIATVHEWVTSLPAIARSQ